jgi:hypothetical protein
VTVTPTSPTEDLDVDGEELEPEPRTLESVCQGRFARSRGYKGFDDIQTLFLENDRETWSAEQECAQPATEGAYIKSYSQARNGIRGYVPDPENGPIDQGIDWGSDDEHAVIWFQELTREVRVQSFKGGSVKVLPVGATVAFAESFKAGIGNTACPRCSRRRVRSRDRASEGVDAHRSPWAGHRDARRRSPRRGVVRCRSGRGFASSRGSA